MKRTILTAVSLLILFVLPPHLSAGPQSWQQTQKIAEIEKQQENTRQELEKPFAQEQELAEKEARLSAVNALLNIDGKNSIPDLMDDTLDIEPPQRAAKDYER